MLRAGLHMHTGSEIKDVNVFAGLEVMFEMARHFPKLEFIDLGSGFKVPYKADDVATDVNSLGNKVAEAFATMKKKMAVHWKYGSSRENTW